MSYNQPTSNGGSAGPAGGSVGGGGNALLQSYQAWSEKTPYITRSLTIILAVFYLISFFIPLELSLSNIPLYSIQKFEIYRLVLSPFAANSIFMLILVIMTFPSLGLKMESSMGSGSFLFLILTVDLIVNVVFVFSCYLLYFLGTDLAILWNCDNFWILLFALITIDCLQLPEAPRRILFIPYDIPSKYMPLALYLLICLFSGFQLSYALSICVGYLAVKGHLDRFRPSSYYLEQLESNGGWLHSMSRSRGYVLAGASLGHDAWIPINAAEPQSVEQQTGFGGMSNSMNESTSEFSSKPKETVSVFLLLDPSP